MIKTKLKSERGIAMVVVLAMLLMAGLIGIASVNTSVVEMDITDAMTKKQKSFYVADGALELAIVKMNDNASVTNRDSILKIVNADTVLGLGHFNIQLTSTSYPVVTVIAQGFDQEGASAVAMNVRHRRNPFNPWNNAIFAGVGRSGKGIAGNVDIHGSVHILGEGEPFTDSNGDGDWDDEDTYVDLNGNGTWQPGEPLSVDNDGDGMWDPAEPFVDENGSGSYDQTLAATDLSFEASGTASVGNNYDGMNATLAAHLPPLATTIFNGETVETLAAELRVKHGTVNLSGAATVGEADASGGSPRIKETMDGVFVNDGYGGTSGSSNIYSDNGTSEQYDLPDGLTDFPSLNDQTLGYSDHRAYLDAKGAVISGDLTLRPGDVYTSPMDPRGYISVDAAGKLTISGIVIVTGNIYIEPGSGGLRDRAIQYDGNGTLVSKGDIHINTHVIAKDVFPTNDAIGFVANQNLYIGAGSGPPQLDLMGAFFAQNEIQSHKANSLAGAMISNYFDISEVPSIYHAPDLADHLPPGMPGGTKYTGWIWKRLNWTWHEL